ncbi:hypothetical protein KIW84_013424 [Lathyrus oleraceus]|uniref:Uncharacterized protein n=1 Tax=Pisum sativum TaxID=3888 RepID=A0A9D5BKE1_PEA|nr:hypothetical protein KIW84_013424 [Pisum sativum]
MRNVVESGKEFGTGTKSTCPLVFPGLIMGFLIASRVRIPNMVPFEIKTKVNDIYVDRFCLEKKKKKRQAEKTGQTSSKTLNYGIDQRKEKKSKKHVLFRYVNSGTLRETKSEAKHPGSLAVSRSEETAKARFAKRILVRLAKPS